jgi:hypothetical protein
MQNKFWVTDNICLEMRICFTQPNLTGYQPEAEKSVTVYQGKG